MNFLSAIMGGVDLICAGILLFEFGLVWWDTPLIAICVMKGGMSFI